MILNKFRDKNIKKKIDKEVTNSKESLNSIPDKKINSVFLFTDENVIENASQIFAEKLNIDISKIEKIVFVKKPIEIDSNNFLSQKDFNWLGKIKNGHILSLVNSEFDLLINLTADNLLLDYLVVLSKAKFKVGFSDADNRLYDFMVDTDKISIFSIELKKYLQILNKL